MPTPEPITIVFAHSGSDAEYEALVQEFHERDRLEKLLRDIP